MLESVQIGFFFAPILSHLHSCLPMPHSCHNYKYLLVDIYVFGTTCQGLHRSLVPSLYLNIFLVRTLTIGSGQSRNAIMSRNCKNLGIRFDRLNSGYELRISPGWHSPLTVSTLPSSTRPLRISLTRVGGFILAALGRSFL